MKTTINLILFLALAWNTANAQVGIGITTPKDDAALEVESTTKGFLPPRMTGAERDAIASPAQGLVIYNTDTDCVQWFNGSAWYDRCEGGLTPGPLSDCPTIPPFLPADETIIKDVTNLNTGQTWMDRNLGAYTTDRSTPGPDGGTDCWAYGNLYQWGRNSDGHEDRTSLVTAGPVAAGSEGSDFIKNDFVEPELDWLTTQDDTRWGNPTDADKGVHDPCPDGYRVPTEAELTAELNDFATQDAEGALASPLKLSRAGLRNYSNGNIETFAGYYWASTLVNGFQGEESAYLSFAPSSASVGRNFRASGFSVRCLKE